MAPRRAPSKSESKPLRSSFRGRDGMRRMAEEQDKAEQRNQASKLMPRQPFRFFVKVDEPREIIVVDHEPDFFRMEHNLKNPKTNRFDLFVPCVDELTNCPGCAVSEKPPYYAMYLTVIDNTPYTNSNDEEIEWSKKLLVVKPAQQKKFLRLLEKHGTLRGMILTMSRSNDKDASIGSDIEFEGFVDEKDLEDYYTEYKDKDNKTQQIDGSEPFDYDEIFPDLSEDDLRAICGMRPAAGSRAGDDRTTGRTRNTRRSKDEDEDDEKPSRGRRASRRDEEEEEEEKPRRSAGRSASRRGRDEEEEEEEKPRSSSRRASRRDEEEEEEKPTRGRRARQEEPEEDEEEEKPSRSSRSGRAGKEEEKPRSSSRRARVPEPEEEEEEPPYEDEEEEEEKPRRSGRSAAKPAARRGRDEEEEEEEKPRSSARASLRRGRG